MAGNQPPIADDAAPMLNAAANAKRFMKVPFDFSQPPSATYPS